MEANGTDQRARSTQDGASRHESGDVSFSDLCKNIQDLEKRSKVKERKLVDSFEREKAAWQAEKEALLRQLDRKYSEDNVMKSPAKSILGPTSERKQVGPRSPARGPALSLLASSNASRAVSPRSKRTKHGAPPSPTVSVELAAARKELKKLKYKYDAVVAAHETAIERHEKNKEKWRTFKQVVKLATKDRPDFLEALQEADAVIKTEGAAGLSEWLQVASSNQFTIGKSAPAPSQTPIRAEGIEKAPQRPSTSKGMLDSGTKAPAIPVPHPRDQQPAMPARPLTIRTPTRRRIPLSASAPAGPSSVNTSERAGESRPSSPTLNIRHSGTPVDLPRKGDCGQCHRIARWFDAYLRPIWTPDSEDEDSPYWSDPSPCVLEDEANEMEEEFRLAELEAIAHELELHEIDQHDADWTFCQIVLGHLIVDGWQNTLTLCDNHTEHTIWYIDGSKFTGPHVCPTSPATEDLEDVFDGEATLGPLVAPSVASTASQYGANLYQLAQEDAQGISDNEESIPAWAEASLVEDWDPDLSDVPMQGRAQGDADAPNSAEGSQDNEDAEQPAHITRANSGVPALFPLPRQLYQEADMERDIIEESYLPARNRSKRPRKLDSDSTTPKPGPIQQSWFSKGSKAARAVSSSAPPAIEDRAGNLIATKGTHKRPIEAQTNNMKIAPQQPLWSACFLSEGESEPKEESSSATEFSSDGSEDSAELTNVEALKHYSMPSGSERSEAPQAEVNAARVTPATSSTIRAHSPVADPRKRSSSPGIGPSTISAHAPIMKRDVDGTESSLSADDVGGNAKEDAGSELAPRRRDIPDITTPAIELTTALGRSVNARAHSFAYAASRYFVEADVEVRRTLSDCKIGPPRAVVKTEAESPNALDEKSSVLARPGEYLAKCLGETDLACLDVPDKATSKQPDPVKPTSALLYSNTAKGSNLESSPTTWKNLSSKKRVDRKKRRLPEEPDPAAMNVDPTEAHALSSIAWKATQGSAAKTASANQKDLDVNTLRRAALINAHKKERGSDDQSIDSPAARLSRAPPRLVDIDRTNAVPSASTSQPATKPPKSRAKSRKSLGHEDPEIQRDLEAVENAIVNGGKLHLERKRPVQPSLLNGAPKKRVRHEGAPLSTKLKQNCRPNSSRRLSASPPQAKRKEAQVTRAVAFDDTALATDDENDSRREPDHPGDSSGEESHDQMSEEPVGKDWIRGIQRKRKEAMLENPLRFKGRGAYAAQLPDTSEELPRPDVPYKETIRSKEARKNLHGVDCACCQGYFEYQTRHLPLEDRHEAAAHLANEISRHRQAYEAPASPPGYWQMGFPSTQQVTSINVESKVLVQEKKAKAADREAKRPKCSERFA